MSRREPRARRPEAPRDQLEGPFTVLLRRLFVDGRVLSAALVDSEGECVDYCTVTDPYEAKVAGAVLSLAHRQVQRFAEATDIGRLGSFEVHGAELDLITRDLGDGYCLAVATEAGGCDPELVERMGEVCVALRAEAGLETPTWDPSEPGLHVATREAVGWPFAPVSFAVGVGEAIPIVDVLGRWEEHGGLTGSQLTCFRVRLEDGREETLAYDEAEDRWMRW